MRTTVVIGIAGGSGSGKTTLAGNLEKQLADLPGGTRVLHMDSYFLPFGTGKLPRHRAPLTGIDYEDHNHPACFDLPRFLGDIDAAIAAEPAVLLTEGLLILQNEDVLGRLDLRVFVDAPADERMYRRVTRFVSRGQKLEDAARFYLDSVRFRHNEFVEPSRWQADLVVNSSRSCDRSVEVLTHWIRAESQRRQVAV